MMMMQMQTRSGSRMVRKKKGGEGGGEVLLRQIGAERVGFSSYCMGLVGDGGVCGEGRLNGGMVQRG